MGKTVGMKSEPKCVHKQAPCDTIDRFAESLPLMVIERRTGWGFINFDELWHYRELLLFLIWRDIKVRYKQTVLGAVWSILQPLATMIVFTLFLGRVAGSNEAKWPYPLFVLAGTIPWSFFSNAIATAGQSVVGSQNLVTKVFFPRLIIPMGAVGAGLVDLIIALALLVGMICWYGVVPSFAMCLVPPILLSLSLSALGVGTLLSALTVAYRDFKHVVPFMVQIWMFATPSIYLQANDPIRNQWNALLPLNPAYGLIAGFRQAMLGEPIDVYSLVISSLVGVAIFVLGCLYFRSVERDFADIV